MYYGQRKGIAALAEALLFFLGGTLRWFRYGKGIPYWDFLTRSDMRQENIWWGIKVTLVAGVGVGLWLQFG